MPDRDGHSSPIGKGGIVGVIRDEIGISLQMAVITIGGHSPEHLDIGMLTNKEGQYQFDQLTPGIYTVIVNAEGYPLHEKQIEVVAGQLARLDFELRR